MNTSIDLIHRIFISNVVPIDILYQNYQIRGHNELEWYLYIITFGINCAASLFWPPFLILYTIFGCKCGRMICIFCSEPNAPKSLLVTTSQEGGRGRWGAAANEE